MSCESGRYCVSDANHRPVCPLRCIRLVPYSRRRIMRLPCPIDCLPALCCKFVSQVVPAAEFVSPCPHLKTTSAALGDGAAPANANGRRARPCADAAHFENNWRGTGTHLAGSHFSRLPAHARNSCDSEALLPTRELHVQMIGEPPPAQAPAQDRSRPGSPTRRRSRASIYQFCLPMKCARIILHFG